MPHYVAFHLSPFCLPKYMSQSPVAHMYALLISTIVIDSSDLNKESTAYGQQY